MYLLWAGTVLSMFINVASFYLDCNSYSAMSSKVENEIKIQDFKSSFLLQNDPYF